MLLMDLDNWALGLPCLAAASLLPTLDPVVTGASLRESRFPFRHENLPRFFTRVRRTWFLRDAGFCRTGTRSAARDVGQHQGNDVGG